MLLLRPGQNVYVRHIKKGSSARAVLMEAGEGVLHLELPGYMAVQEGQELELQTAQQEDALYIVKARVLEKGPGDTCTLEMLKEPLRLQRRRSRRVPTSLKASYLQLPERGPKGKLQQGLILDISSGGALLAVEEPLPVSSEILLLFEVPAGCGEELTTGITGKVVREHRSSEKDGRGYGVQFDKPLAFLS